MLRTSARAEHAAYFSFQLQPSHNGPKTTPPQEGSGIFYHHKHEANPTPKSHRGGGGDTPVWGAIPNYVTWGNVSIVKIK